MTASTSPSLLLRIRDPQDSDAWSQFVEIYTPIVRVYCFQRKIQEADINDVVQDVMSVVSKSIKAFDYDPAKGRFRAWLGTIVANKIKTFLNQRSRQKESQSELEAKLPLGQISYVDPDSDWVAIYSEQVFRTACARIRAEFSEQTWACFEATWMRNESAADVAETLSIPVHSVYVNKSRVLKRLEDEVRILADDVPFPDNSDV